MMCSASSCCRTTKVLMTGIRNHISVKSSQPLKTSSGVYQAHCSLGTRRHFSNISCDLAENQKSNKKTNKRSLSEVLVNPRIHIRPIRNPNDKKNNHQDHLEQPIQLERRPRNRRERRAQQRREQQQGGGVDSHMDEAYREAPYYGTREYILLADDINSNKEESPSSSPSISKQYLQKHRVASLYATRNVMFGATLHQNHPAISSLSSISSVSLMEACASLVHRAMLECGAYGEQVQALATLPGLCSWVQQQCEGEHGEEDLKRLLLDSSSPSLSSGVVKGSEKEENWDLVFQAVQDIAAGVASPPPPHSNSTTKANKSTNAYVAGQDAWEILAKHYAATSPEEVALYVSMGGVVTKVEHLADRSKKYLQTAGGAMVRIFFV